jgi:hypothetical protein
VCKVASDLSAHYYHYKVVVFDMLCVRTDNDRPVSMSSVLKQLVDMLQLVASMPVTTSKAAVRVTPVLCVRVLDVLAALAPLPVSVVLCCVVVCRVTVPNCAMVILYLLFQLSCERVRRLAVLPALVDVVKATASAW